ncbi:MULTISPECIES: NAD(P)H-dependent flavin oxidoreductase [Francisella]|uniref:NAD(P)H-dependent flavin oxidoreductase n=1 Tax=Francisella TaxID=262 RepID=UPI0011B5910E|nr:MULTISPECIES: nitronate monooxygenase [Francisella]
MNLLNLKYPIIQAPMAGNILPVDIIAKVSNEGMLGMIPAGYLSLNDLERMIVDVQSKLLDKTNLVGVNLFIENHKNQVLIKNARVTDLEFEMIKVEDRYKEFLVPQSISHSDYIDLILRHNIKVVSMTFGLLDSYLIQELKNKNVTVIANITSMEEAIEADSRGVDVLVVQGCEAGGHQATFLSEKANDISTLNLLLQIRDAFPKKYIIAAGGISLNNMSDFLNHGANYVQIGSAFMMTKESNLSEVCKKFIQDNFDTTITKNITGKYARGVKNMLISDSSILKYNFPLQHYHTSNLRKLAKAKDIYDLQSLWIGSNQDNTEILGIDDLIEKLKSKYLKFKT